MPFHSNQSLADLSGIYITPTVKIEKMLKKIYNTYVK